MILSHAKARRRKDLLFASVAFVALPLAADNAPEWIQQGVDWIKTLSQSEIKITVPSPEDWQGFWTSFTSSLNSDSVESLASIKPQSEAALDYLDQIPSAKSYADWLRQRLDFIEVAEEVSRAEKQISPVQPPPVKPQPPQPQTRTNAPAPQPQKPPASIATQPPPPVPTPTPAATAKNQRMSRTARSSAIWQKRIAQRPAPESARDLVPRLKKIFRDEGVPEQLVWLGEVESTMNPLARNPGGAAGLFQMMPATAKRFGLRVAPPPDERFDAEKQARGTAQYLKLLNAHFKNWPLALAAYNAGEGRVGRALQTSGGKTFDDIAPLLSVETQMYVPKIDAVLQKREGIELEKIGRVRT